MEASTGNKDLDGSVLRTGRNHSKRVVWCHFLLFVSHFFSFVEAGLSPISWIFLPFPFSLSSSSFHLSSTLDAGGVSGLLVFHFLAFLVCRRVGGETFASLPAGFRRLLWPPLPEHQLCASCLECATSCMICKATTDPLGQGSDLRWSIPMRDLHCDQVFATLCSGRCYW